MVKDAAYYREYRKKKVATVQPNATATDESATECNRGLQPDGSFILSDGQVWHPDSYAVKEHPSVVQMGELRGDLKERRKRMVRYAAWLEAGRPIPTTLTIVTTVKELPSELKT